MSKHGGQWLKAEKALAARIRASVDGQTGGSNSVAGSRAEKKKAKDVKKIKGKKGKDDE